MEAPFASQLQCITTELIAHILATRLLTWILLYHKNYKNQRLDHEVSALLLITDQTKSGLVATSKAVKTLQASTAYR
jgi:hypothetical protein